jgi:hypothetical protein
MRRFLVTGLILLAEFAFSVVTVLAEPVVFDLDGREAVVLVYRNKRPGGRSKYERISVTIKGRTVKAEIADANEFTYFQIGRSNQKDEVVRKALGRGSYGWYYGKDPDFVFPYSGAELDGREVVARLYKNTSSSPGKFEKVVVRASQKNVRFDFEDAENPSVVGLFPGDQEDSVVKGSLHNRVSCWNYKKGLTFELAEENPSKYEEYRWIFADAVGNLLSGASVEIYLATRRPERWILIGKSRLGEEATIELPFCATEEYAHITIGKSSSGFSPGRFMFKISHPDYETVSMVQTRREKYRPEQEITVYAPMLVPGSELEARGIWGVVVDEQGTPVEGVVVRSLSVTPQGGKSIHFTVVRQSPGVLTDGGGRFRFYPRVRESVETIGPVVPAKSKYLVRIEPPEDMGFVAFKGRIPNGEANVIRLERAEEKYFHRLVFEDENGLITESQRLKYIDVEIERDDKVIDYLNYREWNDGGEFPLGVYKARYNPSREQSFKFLPVEVTEESPEEVVFRTVSGQKKYYGKIVHGVTGAPMEGVFVKVGGGRNPTELSEQQWRVFHALPGTDPNVKESEHGFESYVTKSIVRIYRSGRMVRTDGEGLFEMTFPAKTYMYKFSIFEEGYLLVHVENDLFEKDDEGNIRLPITRMFPSAKIVIDPWSHVTGRSSPRNFYPRWIVDTNRSRSWVKDLLAACIDDHEEGIFRGYSIDSNRGPQNFHVPAGVTFELQLRPWPYFYREDSIWSSVTLGRDLKLDQGEVLDLGRIEIKEAFSIFVEVLNSMGAAVEGLPVKARDQYGEVVSNTDDNGVAMFTVARDSRGEFVVEYEPQEGQTGPHLRESAPYEIKGPEDANSGYSFRVSDEIIYQLIK